MPVPLLTRTPTTRMISAAQRRTAAKVESFCLPGDQLQSAAGRFPVVPVVSYLPFLSAA